MRKIPFYKPSIGPEEIEEVVDTLKSGWLTTGPKTKKFEAAFATYLQQKHAVAVNSCTAALHLALEAIGIRAGDGVVVPTMTFAATAEVVRYLGARPILVDVRTTDLNLNVDDANQRIRQALREGHNVRAIIPVHYGGQMGDVEGIRRLASLYRLKIIEDAAHCCPAYYRKPSGYGYSDEVWQSDREAVPTNGDSTRGVTDSDLAKSDESCQQDSQAQFPQSAESAFPEGRIAAEGPTDGWYPVGHDADISCYSFYANKTITTGEGGMACTQNDEYADRMRIMSLHGISRDAWKRFTGEGSWYYEILAPGFKYNLTDIASAIGLHQLRKADEFHRRRTAIAAQYSELLKDIEEINVPQAQPGRVHSWHLYSIRVRPKALGLDRAEFIAELQKRGIGTSVHWLPLHMHPYYRETYGYIPEDLPTAANLYPELVTLPVYPEMTESDVEFVCSNIREIIATHQRASVPVTG